MLIAYSLLGGASLYIICQDVRNQTIPISGVFIFLSASLLRQLMVPEIQGFMAAGVIALVLFGCYGIFYLKRDKIVLGKGDLILGPLCGLWIFLEELPIFFLAMGGIGFLMGLVWRLRWQCQTFPMAPAIIAGLGFVFLIRCFLRANGV